MPQCYTDLFSGIKLIVVKSAMPPTFNSLKRIKHVDKPLLDKELNIGVKLKQINRRNFSAICTKIPNI